MLCTLLTGFGKCLRSLHTQPLSVTETSAGELLYHWYGKSGEDWNGLFKIFSYRNQIILMYPDFYYKSFTSSRLQNAFDTLIAFKIHREKHRLLNYHFG